MQEVPMMGILIRRPVQKVFDYVMNIEKTPSWRPRMSEVHWITGDDPGLGSRFQVVVRTLGLTLSFQPEIIHWDPPRSVVFRQSTGPAQMEGWMRFLAPVVGRSILSQNMRDLERLKNQLEHEPSEEGDNQRTD